MDLRFEEVGWSSACQRRVEIMNFLGASPLEYLKHIQMRCSNLLLIDVDLVRRPDHITVKGPERKSPGAPSTDLECLCGKIQKGACVWISTSIPIPRPSFLCPACSPSQCQVMSFPPL
jgi:hypothetical protein